MEGKEIEKIVDEWLFAPEKVRKTYNPFLKILGQIGRDCPEVPMPEGFEEIETKHKDN